MVDRQQDLGKEPVDLMSGPVKIPDGLTLTHVTRKPGEEIELEKPEDLKDLEAWIMTWVAATGKAVNVVVDHDTRTVRPRPLASKTG